MSVAISEAPAAAAAARSPSLSEQVELRRRRRHVITLWFEAAITPDVDHSCAGAREGGSDEETTMTVRRVFLGAEDRGPPTLRERDETQDPLREVGGCRAVRVVDGAVLPIEIAAGRTTSKLPAQEDVVDAARVQQPRQSVRVEVRRPLRVGLRSHIDEPIDFVRVQERQKVIGRVP